MASSSPTASYTFVFKADCYPGGSDGDPWQGATVTAVGSDQSFRITRFRDILTTPDPYQIETCVNGQSQFITSNSTRGDLIVGIESLAASATGTSVANPMRVMGVA